MLGHDIQVIILRFFAAHRSGSGEWRRTAAALLALLAIGLTSSATAADRLIAHEDFPRWPAYVSDAVLSPDGRYAAVNVSRRDHVDDRYVGSLLLIDIDTGMQREIVPGRLQAGSPRWSPTGDRLAWLDGAEGGTRQLYVMPFREGVIEPAQSVRTVESIASFAWSPDGQFFAFTTSETTPPEDTSQRSTSKGFQVGDNHYRATAAPTNRFAVLKLLPAAGGPTRLLTPRTENIDVKGFRWLPDGRSIVISSRPKGGSGGLANVSLQTADIATGTIRTVVQGPEDGAALNILFEPSPDGKWLAYSRRRGAEPEFRAESLRIVPTAGGESLDLSAGIDRNFRTHVAWAPDARSIIASIYHQTRYRLLHKSLQGPYREVDLGPLHVEGMSMSRTGALLLTASQAQRPTELYFMQSIDDKPRRLTDFGRHADSLSLGRVETVTWRLDGFEQTGVLTYPPNYKAGNKYPLVLQIHGGPMAHASERFDAFGQLMAAQGWLVFSPNYRGSTAHGDAFQAAIINDAGDGPGRDVMAGIEALKIRGLVDESRIAVSGWSYGGYMTAWLTSRYPEVWRAAVAGAAITDFVDYYSLSDLNVWMGSGLGGSPWVGGNLENYQRQSPITHAHRIRTPTLILANTGDVRVPITQSYKLYYALKDNGTRVQFTAYPFDGHGMGSPLQERDIQHRWIAWIKDQFVDSGNGGRP